MAINLANPVNWQHPLNKGLVSWVKVLPRLPLAKDLCYPSKGVTYNGASAFGNTSTLYGSIGVSAASSQYVNLGPRLSSYTGGAFSVFFDVFWRGTVAQDIYSNGIVTAGTILLQVDASGKYKTHLWNSGGSSIFSSFYAALTANTWYRLGFIYDGSATTYQITNGVPEGNASSGTPATTANDMLIGTRGGSDYFDGLVDNIRFYNRYVSYDVEALDEYKTCRYKFRSLLNETDKRPTIFLPSAGSFKSAWARGSNVILQPGVLT